MRPRYATFLLLTLGLGCKGDEGKANAEVGSDSKAVEASPAEQACTAAKSEGTVVGWLRVKAEHPKASCVAEIDPAIARISKVNDEHADDTSTPTVLIDGDGIWFPALDPRKPTVPKPPGSEYNFAALEAEAKKYKQLFLRESAVRLWAADVVPPADLLRTVETLRGQGCKVTRREPENAIPNDKPGPPRARSKSALDDASGASEECMFWRVVLLGERPEVKPPPPPATAEDKDARLRCEEQHRRFLACKNSCINEAPDGPDHNTLAALCIRMECPSNCEPEEVGG